MLIPALPDDARVWLFAADRPFTPDEAQRLQAAADALTANWTSHGRAVPAGAAVVLDRVLVVAAALSGGVSGCGIDSMTHSVDAAAAALGFGWTSALDVVYRNADGALRAVPRPAFRALARAGGVTTATPVLDLTANTLGAARAGLERPAGDAWHGRAFRLAPRLASA